MWHFVLLNRTQFKLSSFQGYPVKQVLIVLYNETELSDGVMGL